MEDIGQVLGEQPKEEQHPSKTLLVGSIVVSGVVVGAIAKRFRDQRALLDNYTHPPTDPDTEA